MKASVLGAPVGMGAALFLVAGAAILAAPAAACPIPVYQYSLEWWDVDPYEVYIFDNGSLTDEQEAVIERLERIAGGGDSDVPANLRLRRVQNENEDRLFAHSVLRGHQPDSFPWMVIFYPSLSTNVQTPVWMGEVSEANVEALLHSPVRQEITDMLLDRTSVVWVLLESGDASADDAAYEVLEQEARRLQDTLVLPNPDRFGFEDIEITDIRFETMRLSRNDDSERVLLEMLLQSEVDLKDYDSEPMVFPIFGRGLVMHALIGRGINAHMIRETAEFLAGPTDHTAKAMNPGTEILTAVDWNGKVEPVSQEWTTEPSGLGGFLDGPQDAGES